MTGPALSTSTTAGRTASTISLEAVRPNSGPLCPKCRQAVRPQGRRAAV